MVTQLHDYNKTFVVIADHTFGKIKEDTPEDTCRETKIFQNLLQNTTYHLRILRAAYFYDLVRKQDLNWVSALKLTTSKRSIAASRYNTIFVFFCLVSYNRHLASLLGQNFTPNVVIHIKKTKSIFRLKYKDSTNG